MLIDPRDILHKSVDDLCDAKEDQMRKWLSVLTDAEALIAALPDSMEKEIALQKMTECAWWYSLAATDTSIMDNATAKRAVRKMRR